MSTHRGFVYYPERVLFNSMRWNLRRIEELFEIEEFENPLTIKGERELLNDWKKKAGLIVSDAKTPSTRKRKEEDLVEREPSKKKMKKMAREERIQNFHTWRKSKDTKHAEEKKTEKTEEVRSMEIETAKSFFEMAMNNSPFAATKNLMKLPDISLIMEKEGKEDRVQKEREPAKMRGEKDKNSFSGKFSPFSSKSVPFADWLVLPNPRFLRLFSFFLSFCSSLLLFPLPSLLEAADTVDERGPVKVFSGLLCCHCTSPGGFP